MKIKIFCDGANLEEILKYNQDPEVAGMTTNPSLMKKAGINDYQKFCLEVLRTVKEKPLSFEVFADDLSEMERQAQVIAPWGKNVYVKIPIINTKGEWTTSLIEKLSKAGVKVNVTAVLTDEQVDRALTVLKGGAPSILSIFAGRIADTGRDPIPLMQESIRKAREQAPSVEVLWASTREVFNLVEADRIGCGIITVPGAILEKFRQLRTKSLLDMSLDTVRTFKKDSDAAGFSL